MPVSPETSKASCDKPKEVNPVSLVVRLKEQVKEIESHTERMMEVCKYGDLDALESALESIKELQEDVIQSLKAIKQYKDAEERLNVRMEVGTGN